MPIELTPEFAIRWTKFSTGLLFTWPPGLKATRLTKIIFEIGWWIFFIHSVVFAIPQLYTIYKKRGIFIQFTESLCLTSAELQVMAKMIIAKWYYQKFQDVIGKIETFVENTNLHERHVFMNFVKRIAPFHFTFNAITFLACTAYAIAPLGGDQPLPDIAEFPFPVNEHPVYDIVYLLEAISGYQCGCTAGLDCQLGLFLWYWTIQLEFVTEKMRNVRSDQELKECISRHQHILRSINGTIEIVRPVVMTTIIMATITLACGGIHIIGNAPVMKKVSFVVINIAYALELLCVAWAAENLTTACEKVGWALYDSPWIQQSKDFNKIAIIVMQKCQNPPVIGISGFLPKLSLNYYTTYMSVTYSFFTTLNVMLKKFENHG